MQSLILLRRETDGNELDGQDQSLRSERISRRGAFVA